MNASERTMCAWIRARFHGKLVLLVPEVLLGIELQLGAVHESVRSLVGNRAVGRVTNFTAADG